LLLPSAGLLLMRVLVETAGLHHIHSPSAGNNALFAKPAAAAAQLAV
jgi:hypothetical protein